jgi:hypothetical protein
MRDYDTITTRYEITDFSVYEITSKPFVELTRRAMPLALPLRGSK